MLGSKISTQVKICFPNLIHLFILHRSFKICCWSKTLPTKLAVIIGYSSKNILWWLFSFYLGISIVIYLIFYVLLSYTFMYFAFCCIAYGILEWLLFWNKIIFESSEVYIPLYLCVYILHVVCYLLEWHVAEMRSNSSVTMTTS